MNNADMESTNVLGISGSIRQGSYNTKLLRYIQSCNLFPMEIFSLENIPLFNEDVEANLPEPVQSFRESVRYAKAILIATPEYNWRIPGVLKNALDWLSTNKENDIKGKKAAIAGTSSGRFGTVRAQLELRPLLTHMGVHVMNTPNLFVSFEQQVFNEQGQVIDAQAKAEIDKFAQGCQAYFA